MKLSTKQPTKQLIITALSSKRALGIIAFIGLLLAILIVKLQDKTAHILIERPSVSVNYINLATAKVNPEIIGYGTVEPNVSLQSKAEVSGRVVYMHPNLKKGEIFAKGTLLLKIDDKDYLLKLKQAQADLLSRQANLTEMQLSIKNNQLELDLAKKKLAVRQQEFHRKSELQRKGLISQSSLDAEQQNLFLQQQEILKLNNLQITLPSQLAVINAQVDIANINIASSQRDLERTQVVLPFDGRISQVYTELEQFMEKSAPIFNAIGLDKVLINAQFPMDQFSLFAKNFNKEQVNIEQIINKPSMATVLASLALTAKVENASGKFKPWLAKVERLSDNLDPQSKTVGVVVSITGSYQGLEPGTKPPLLQGMYMKVTLQSAATDFIAIPRFALHQSQLYKIDQNNELKRIAVDNLQYQGELLLIKPKQYSHINIGDKIITSDLYPVVNGMALSPVLDTTTQQQIQHWLYDETTHTTDEQGSK